MTMLVEYIGSADIREIRAEDFTRVGLTHATIVFNKANGFEIELPDDIALYLTAQDEFQTSQAEDFEEVLDRMFEGGASKLVELTEQMQFLLGDAPGVVLHGKAERDRDGATYWPDGNMGYRVVGGIQTFVGANGGGIGSAILDGNGKLDVTSVVSIAGLEVATRYAGGGPVFKIGSTEYMIYHGEEWSTGPGDPTNETLFWAFLGLAKLIGSTWTHVIRIVEPDATKAVRFAAGNNTDVLGGPFTIMSGGDELYVWHKDTVGGTGTAAMTTLSVTKCNISGTADAGKVENPTNWSKWNGTAWGAAGSNLGGLAGELVPEPLPGYTGWFDVAKLEDGRIVLLVTNDNGLWSVQHCIAPDNNPLQFGSWFIDVPPTTTEQLYVSLVSSSRFTTPDTVDLDDAYFLTTTSVIGGDQGAGNRWNDATVIARPFSIDGLNSLVHRVDVLEQIVEEGPDLEVAPWVTVTSFINGWAAADLGAGPGPIKYRKHLGTGYLMIPPMNGTSSTNATMFQLPVGYRPTSDEALTGILMAASNLSTQGPGNFTLDLNGNVQCYFADPTKPVFMGVHLAFRLPA